MRKGYQSLLTFNADPNVLIWEKGVQPPGMDGGDAIDASTMHNVDWRTMFPQALITLTEATCRGAWKPALYTELLALINVETTVTCWFSNGGYIAFYGFMRTFEPDEMVEGEQPEASFTIQPTNWDPTNNVEAGPAIGTGS
jgi:hypothetical protein